MAALLAGTVAGLAAAVTAAAAERSSSWVTPSDGDWIDATRWSTNPYFPNDGTPAGDLYDASITATGKAYTVNLDQDVSVRSLTVGGSGALAFKNQNGVTKLSLQQLTVQSGASVTLDRAAIVGGSIGGAGYVQVRSYTDGFLNGVSLEAEARINDSASLAFTGSTALAGATVRFLGQGNTLELTSPGLSGQGSIVFDGPGGTIRIFNSSVNTAVVAPGVVVRTGLGGGGLATSDSAERYLNYGELRSETGKTLGVGNLDNRGVIHASGANSSFGLTGTWVNTGSITVDGATLSAISIPAPADVGKFYVHDGRFELRGGSTVARLRTLDIANSVIALADFGGVSNEGVLPVVDGTNVWRLAGGSIAGGIVDGGSGHVPLRVEKGAAGTAGISSLYDVRLQADVQVDRGAQLLLGGISTLVDGRTIRLGGAELAVEQPKFLGVGSKVVFDGAGVDSKLRLGSFTGTQTVPAGVQVSTGAGGGRMVAIDGAIVNNGIVSAVTDGQVVVLQAEQFQNHGTVEVEAGDVVLEGTYQPSNGSLRPSVMSSDGTLRLGVGGDLSVNGSLSLLAGGTSRFSFAGKGSEEFGQIVASAGTTVGGVLQAELAQGYEPTFGETFAIISAAGGLTGSFSSFTSPTWSDGMTLELRYSANAATLVAVPEPGGVSAVGATAVLAAIRRRRARR